MTKPWERTWRVSNGALVTGSIDDSTNVLYEKHTDNEDWHLPNVQLASAAPELVRLVLGYEWRVNANGVTPEGGCPSCSESRLNGHAEGCQLVAVLCKAGVPRDEFDVQPPNVPRPARLERGKDAVRRLEAELVALKVENARLEQTPTAKLRQKLRSLLEALDEGMPDG